MNQRLPSIPAELLPTFMEVIDLCPVERCNPVDCPLFEVRKLPRRQRLHWLNSLSKAELQYLAAYHKVCMSLKLAAHPPATPASRPRSHRIDHKPEPPKAPEAS